MIVTILPTVNPGNPFRQDPFSMGVLVAENLMVMTHHHTNEKADSVVLWDPTTGQRLRVDLEANHDSLSESSWKPRI